MKKNWNEGSLKEKDILSQLLKNRGIEGKIEIENFLNPKSAKLLSPYLFTDMERAEKRVKRAIKDGEHILIWGDFDADGVSSTALLYKVFKSLGANFSHFIPNREEHGHGLNSKELVKIIAKKKLKVLITVDCGISDGPVVSMLKGLGVDVIITDHHRVEGDLPDAFAIINPRAQGAIVETATVPEIKSLCDLAGVGVAYKFACTLVNKPDLALVALGTIADVVPLLGENRTLVALGLDEIKNHKGISRLFENAGFSGSVSAENVAFILAPRINAVGRLCAPDEAFNLLVADSLVSIDASIQKLNDFNSVRQNLCDEIYLQCLKKISTPGRAIMLYDDSWHVGIIGIVASRLVEKFNVPVFLATKNNKGEGRCSIRALAPYNIYEILKENSTLFLGYGGHAFAGGFAFEEDFESIKNTLLNSISEEEVQNVLNIDLELNAEQIDNHLIENISLLEPLGQGNGYPVFSLKNVTLLSSKQVGKEGNHLKFEIKKDDKILSCVWWKKSNFNFQTDSKLDIAFSPKINTFNGNTTIQLEILDAKGEEAEIKIYDHRQKKLSEILPKINEYVSKGQVRVVANKLSTLDCLSKYEEISSCIGNNNCDEIMLFDYPTSTVALKLLLSPHSKIHLMQEVFEREPLQYLDSIFKMLKFAHNKKSGEIDFEKMANLLGVTIDFIKISLEFLQNTNAIGWDGESRVELLSNIFEFNEENPMHEILIEELASIVEYKRALMSLDLAHFKSDL